MLNVTDSLFQMVIHHLMVNNFENYYLLLYTDETLIQALTPFYIPLSIVTLKNKARITSTDLPFQML